MKKTFPNSGEAPPLLGREVPQLGRGLSPFASALLPLGPVASPLAPAVRLGDGGVLAASETSDREKRENSIL
jgi:hypothetical protein